MREQIVFVICRRFWEAPDESRLEWLTRQGYWTRKKDEAWLYRSRLVFTDADSHGGGVMIRFPSGREEPISKKDFNEE